MAFTFFLLLLDLLLLPSSLGQPSGAASGKNFLLTLSAKLASCFFSVLGTVSLGSQFERKESTSATGNSLFSLGYSFDRLPVGTGIIKQVFFTEYSHQVV